MNHRNGAKPDRFESRLYNSLQRLNKVCDEATTLEEMLELSLDLMLDIFDCDRAWLIHPCDPDASFFEVKMERTRRGWPGAFQLKIPISIDEEMKKSLTFLLAQDEPLISDLKKDTVFRDTMEKFSVNVQLSVVIHTKLGKPWMLGIHHCEKHPVLSNQDILIFFEFANRLGESLSYMLMLNDMRQSKERYRLLFDSLVQGVIYQDACGHILEVNPAAEKILGVDKAELSKQVNVGSWFHPFDKNGLPIIAEQHPVPLAISAGKPVNDIVIGIIHPEKKTKHWISVNASPQFDKRGVVLECVVCTLNDITSLRVADEAMISHLRFLDSMERISRITISELSVNDMLNNVLDEMLDIFDCSRAWFLYPCDPHAETWSIPITRTRPEWPGAEVGVEMPVSEEVKLIFAAVAATNGPVVFNADHDKSYESAAETVKFKVRSQMLIKLSPKVTQSWILGIHHCESAHDYSSEEQELFTEISRRIADSLSTLITLQNFKVSEARFRTLVEHAPEAIFVFDVDKNNFSDVNDNAVRLFKKNRNILKQENYLSISPELQPDGQFSETLMQKYISVTIDGEAPVFDWIFNDADKQTIPCEVRLVRLPDEKRLLIRCSITDITERVKAQKYLQHLAHHDSLTDLPNRNMLVDRLEQAIVRATRKNKMVAILFLDLDHFKIINDTLGHDVGDKSLQKIATTIDSNLRASDTVARFGGDEFVILLEEIQKQKEITAIVDKLLSVITEPMNLEGHEIIMSASIGISLFPNDSDNVSTLLKYADIAMYRAKDRGRNSYEFYSSDMSIKAFERLTLETRLRRAVKLKEFELVYQPQIDVNTNQIVGAEALMRWHPEGMNSISPNVFIPLLEETGLIVEVGEWLIDTALSQLKKVQDNISNFKMSINLSSRQFQNKNLIEILEQSIVKHQINPQHVELEITESLLMEHHHITLSTLNRISELGLHLSIDDFGTGYSSLSYLKQFPIDTLKIDRSFVRDITTDPNDEAIVTAIIALAKSLNLQLIAEGVETEQQFQFIKDNKCQVAQGYYFSKPLSVEKLEEYLA